MFRLRSDKPSIVIAALVIGMVLSVAGSVFATTVGNSISITSLLSASQGTAAAPSITFSSDTDTGIFRSDQDIFGFTTAGSERAQFTQSGSFGIGTTSPGGFLALATATSSPGILVRYTGTGPALYIEDAANDTTPFVIDASGNLGIGTTSPGSILAVGRQGESVGGYFFTNIGLGIGTSSPGAGLAFATTTTGTQTAFLVSNLGTGATAWFEDAANDASPFVVDAAGNVGVGTSSPGTLLSIHGVANFLADATSSVYSRLSLPHFSATSTAATTTISTGGFQVGSQGAAAFTVMQSATTSVGVGTSTPSSHQFEVGGNALIGGGGSNATSTLTISSSGTRIGGCIELRAADGGMIRIYASSSVMTGSYNNLGLAMPGRNLIVEAGGCR